MKAQSLFMSAALVLAVAIGLCFGSGLVRDASCPVGDIAMVPEHDSLPELAQAALATLPDPVVSQTDNGTFLATSGGAVEASFTVITRPGSDLAESGNPPTAVEEDASGAAHTAIPAQGANGLAGDRQVRHNHSDTAAGAGPESGGLSRGWALLIGVWVLVDLALGVLAFHYGRSAIW